jgi:hypothetical protein
MPAYSQEQLLELYNNLPKALQDAVYSEQNAKNIEEICAKNNIKDDSVIEGIKENVCYVLLGLLPPSELSLMLEKELELNKGACFEISNSISRYIFFPLRAYLEPLYGAPVSFKTIISQKEAEIMEEEARTREQEEPEEQINPYRESVE